MESSGNTKGWLRENWFKVGLLLSLLLAIGLVAYYFMIFIPQRDANRRAAIEYQQETIRLEKLACVSTAGEEAVELYEASPLCTGPYAPADCKDHKTYLADQYDHDYTTCLQSKGLE